MVLGMRVSCCEGVMIQPFENSYAKWLPFSAQAELRSQTLLYHAFHDIFGLWNQAVLRTEV